MGTDGRADEGAAGEVQAAQDFCRASLRDHQAVDGYTHITLKGLEDVRTEWSLITLAYNLKRVLNLVSFEKLMAALA